MRSVTRRLGVVYHGDGTYSHNEEPLAYEEAERIAGRRLDRRRNYCVIDGKVCEAIEWTQCCSGCADDRENVSCDQGSGCHECGYTGKVRSGMWVPIEEMEHSRKLTAEFDEWERSRAAPPAEGGQP